MRIRDAWNRDERTHKQRAQAGDWYLGSDPQLLADGERAAQLTAEFAETFRHSPQDARAVLAGLVAKLGDTVVRPPLYVDYGYFLSIGDGGFINYGLTALDGGPITIGDGVAIGPHVQLLATSHPLDPDEREGGVQRGLPITIEDNAWIGAGAIVLGGVTVGAGAVVGAGSLVNRDVAPRTLVAGNPASVVRGI